MYKNQTMACNAWRRVMTCFSLRSLPSVTIIPGGRVTRFAFITVMPERVLEHCDTMPFAVCRRNRCVAYFFSISLRLRRGWSWVVREPVWWCEALAGIPHSVSETQAYSVGRLQALAKFALK